MPAKRQDELRELVDDPNETLENEYKSWLDLSDPETRAGLARHLSALANHGGGRIVVGFSDDLKYAGPNPYSAVSWDRDSISGIVKKYLEPTFQCDVFGVQSTAGNQHPIVFVPPHGGVPICSKADGPTVNGKPAGIRNGTYYIRKTGPESAPITTSDEWRALIRRCVMHDRAALLAAIDASLRGATKTPTADEILRKWHDAAYAKYVRNVEKFKAPSELVERNFQLSYLIQTQDGQRLDPSQLREALMRVNVEVYDLVHTGWSMFYVFTVPEVAASFSVDPAVDEGNQDFLECSLLADISKRGFGADTWRVATDGRATLIRDYWEDEVRAVPTTGVKPGSWFSPNMMARSLAEFVRHARGFAEKFDVPTSVVFRCEWRDLAGRMVFDPSVLWRSGQKSKAENRIVTAGFPIAELKNSWPDIVAELGSPVARLFGIDEVFTPQWVAGQAPTWLR
jgi:hypothetical protein